MLYVSVEFRVTAGEIFLPSYESGAGHTTTAFMTFKIEFVDWQVIFLYVIPNLLPGPECDWVELPNLIAFSVVILSSVTEVKHASPAFSSSHSSQATFNVVGMASLSHRVVLEVDAAVRFPWTMRTSELWKAPTSDAIPKVVNRLGFKEVEIPFFL